MTQPEADGPTVPDEESIAFEEAAVAAVTGALAAAVLSVTAGALAAYGTVGGMSAAAGRVLAASISGKLRGIRWSPMRPKLERVAVDARVLGRRRAVDALDRAPRLSRLVRPGALPDLDAGARERLAEAVKLASTLPMMTKTDVLAVVGKANSAVSYAKGGTRWTANEGINAGTAEVARAAGLRLLWVAERDACLHCLAHAGWVVEPGDPFPGVSFDPQADDVPAVSWPPLHPNCRCQVRTYDGPAGQPDTNRSLSDPAARLAAEARRSVVYRWTDHASQARATAAADALLRQGASLPGTVEQRARRALRSGTVIRKPT